MLYFVRNVLHCNGNIILEKPLDFMHCVASSFGYPNYRFSELSVTRTIGYPNYRLSELSLVPIISDNRRSTVSDKTLEIARGYDISTRITNNYSFVFRKNTIYMNWSTLSRAKKSLFDS